MAKECLQNRACPRIRDVLRSVEYEGFLASPFTLRMTGFANESSNSQRLIQACINSYNCDGPKIQEVEVERGIFKVKTVIERQRVCGLDK